MLSLRQILILTTCCVFGTSVNSQEYIYDDDHDCNFYDLDHHECHHDSLAPQFLHLKNDIQPNVPLCCGEGRYSFHDSCESNEETYGKNACGKAGELPTLPDHEITCPDNCLLKKDISDFNITTNGSLFLSDMHESLYIRDFCVTITCLDESIGWETIVKGCFCLKDSELIKAKNQDLNPNLNLCCPKDTLTHEEGNQLNCVTYSQEAETVKVNKCDERFLVINNRFVKISDTEISFNRRGEPTTLNISSPTYCFGTSIKKNSFSDLSSPSSFMRSELFYCQAYPCDGATPCISTCCNPGEILLKENHTCISPDWSNATTFLDLEEDHDRFSNMFHFRTRQQEVLNFEKRALRPCSEGYESVILSKCYQSFHLEESKENGTYLTIDVDGSHHYVNEYCVYITEDKKFMGNVCREIIGKAKFKYYPIILIGSALFLLFTILIYSIYGKQLLNHYTRLMRHFTVGLFVAFTVLSFNQLFAFMSFSLLLCQIVGFIQQFSFLVSFTFMTLMSSEIFMKMKSLTSTNSQKRFNIQRLIGYGVPLIITAITITVELTAPECSKFKPRFGEKQCFFAGKEAIFIYFNIPILIMLLINTIMFFGTVMTILKVQRAAKSYFKNQRESLDRFALFMKLFLGMGIIWIFEILAKGTSGIIPQEVWYFTDFLNMLQGFYVFLIFVCKRNVIEVILKKDSKSGSSVRTGENNQSGGSHWLKLRNRQKSSMGTSLTNLDTVDSVK